MVRKASLDSLCCEASWKLTTTEGERQGEAEGRTAEFGAGEIRNVIKNTESMTNVRSKDSGD